MVRHLPGLQTGVRRACSKERSEGEDSGEKAKFDGNETRSAPIGCQTPSGGHSGIHALVRVGDNIERPGKYEQGLSEEYQQNVQGVTWGAFLDTGGLFAG